MQGKILSKISFLTKMWPTEDFMKFLNLLALLLIIAGALNWGLWGFFQFDFVAWLAHGNTTWLARLIYAIIGLAGVKSLGFLGRCKAICGCSSEQKPGNPGSSSGGCCK
jgi:uncharacterized protein